MQTPSAALLALVTLASGCSSSYTADSGTDGGIPNDSGTLTTTDAAAADAGTVVVDAGPPPPEPICEPWKAPTSRNDQSVVPVEVAPRRPGNKKVILIAGAPSGSHPSGQHEFFAGLAVLAKMLCQTPGVTPVLVKNGWPSDPTLLEGAASIVVYADGGPGHPLLVGDRLATVGRLMAAGTGFANLHYALEYVPGAQGQVLPWIGGVYEAGTSVNPMWTGTFAPAPHETTRGLPASLVLDDEWYYNLRWKSPQDGITPLMQAVPPDGTRTTADAAAHPGRSETTSWVYARPDGGRSFGFTGGHWYGSWLDGGNPNGRAFRRLLTNGVLWTAKVPVPEGGAPVELAPADEGNWQDTKG